MANIARDVFFPYYVKRQPDGKYVFVNKDKKPVGFYTQDYVDYSKYPVAVRFKGLTPAKAARISCYGFPDVDDIQLFDDSCSPLHSPKDMNDYLRRYAMLMKLKIIPEHEYRPPMPKKSEVA